MDLNVCKNIGFVKLLWPGLLFNINKVPVHDKYGRTQVEPNRSHSNSIRGGLGLNPAGIGWFVV
jgi:hypothetical protein